MIGTPRDLEWIQCKLVVLVFGLKLTMISSALLAITSKHRTDQFKFDWRCYQCGPILLVLLGPHQFLNIASLDYSRSF